MTKNKLKELVLVSLTFGMVACSEEFIFDAHNDPFVRVGISTGAIQCQYEGNNIAVSKAYLTGQGISVEAAFCGYTLTNYPAVCGAGTSDIHVFEINRDELAEAENLGFVAVSSYENGWKKTTCPND
ncbi:hypothetical protein J1N51_13165 [Psychrosphaera ytuae]|uniref:Lipoprotein n=1 Tax=Psychrosphaera ytuae TaxID=2820710 RepID=A0A975DBE0_9GAMM|nr:hypothetical protein [Psychrosphaera ytuae]QTH63654.1 hypothetical protein J1N51_13165 [Psychrosphaera ytuae]